MPAPRPLSLQNPSQGRQIRAALHNRGMGGSTRITHVPSRVAPQALRVGPKVRVSLVRRHHGFTGLRAEPCRRSRTSLSPRLPAPETDSSRASTFPVQGRRGLSAAVVAGTSAASASGPAVDVLGRRRSSQSSSKGAASRARRQRCLPACFLPDKTPASQCSDRPEPIFGSPQPLGQSMSLPFQGAGPSAVMASLGDSARKSATALALSSTAASLLLLLPVGLPGSPELAQAAPESAVERSSTEIVSLSQDVATFEEMLQNFDSLEGVPSVDATSGTDNLGFLSLDSEPSASGSFSDAAPEAPPQDQEQAVADTSPRPTPVLSEGPAVTAEPAPAPLDDTCVPLTDELHAALAAERAPSVSPPASPRRLSPAPAIYTPPTAAQDSASSSSSSGGSSAGLLVPVSAAAAAATFSAAPSGAAAAMEASVAAQTLMSAVPAAKEAAAAVAEPVIAGAAAATEAVAAAAASVAEPVVASAAAAAASASSGLSAKLSLILAQSLQHLGVGGVAGAVGATVVYPLDTVKTRMQAQTRSPSSSKGAKDGEDAADGPGEDAEILIRSESGEHQVRVMRSELPEPYKNEFDCMWRMVQEEGVTSLYSGLGAQLVGIAPEKAVKLTVNEVLLAILEALMPGTRVWMLELIAGGGGGACQVVFTNPVEAVKVRLQAQRPQAGRDLEAETGGSHAADGASSASASRAVSDSPVGDGAAKGRALEGLGQLQAPVSGSSVMAETGATKDHHHQQHHPDTIQVVQELGLKGLYTGSALTLARDVPSTALFFASYAYLTQPEQQERFLAAASCLSPFVYVFLAACVSSIPASVLVTPFDVVKTRMQIQHANGTGRAPTAMEVARQLVLEEGPMALFKGGMARALRVGPQLGITLMTYDWLCKHW